MLIACREIHRNAVGDDGFSGHVNMKLKILRLENFIRKMDVRRIFAA